MDLTPTISRFDDFYKNQTPPWVIGEPQPAIVDLERAGTISGRVLDVGCGTGEHTILLAGPGMTCSGSTARRRLSSRPGATPRPSGVDARFEVADALHLNVSPGYDTIVDSALFHIFDDADRATYVRSLHGATRPGGAVHVLALSDAGRGFGPEVSEVTIRGAFGTGWQIEELTTTTYRGVVAEAHAKELGLAVGTRVDEPAWLLRVRRI